VIKEKRGVPARSAANWEESRISAALAVARIRAARFSRDRGLSRPDREDLTQDILLAIVEASPRFDAARGHWASFVAVLAQHVVIDRARQAAPPVCLSLDAPGASAILDRLSAPAADADIGLSLLPLEEMMPPRSLALLRAILAHGDVVAAREAGAVSPATFYRALQELRCWLRALGARPVGGLPHTTRARQARRA
jgi:DNA-directed RNA polymerase specialized sigma24 family protein